MKPLLAELNRLPSHKQEEGAIASIARLGRDHLYIFAKYILGLSEVNPVTHASTIQNLHAPTLRKLIVMPRGTFKSSLASVAYPMWCLIRNPNLRILLDSELYTNSKNLLREIKDRMREPKLVELYGQFENRLCWNEGEIIIKQRTKVKKEASITCSGIGAGKTGQHYDIIIGDDLNSPKNSHTPEGTQKVIDHYRMYTSLLDPGGTIVLVGTRYSENDCIGFALANEIFPQEEIVQGLL